MFFIFFYFFLFFFFVVFFDKYAVKNNLQNKIQITFSLMTCNNIDFDREQVNFLFVHVIVTYE